jgi:hypothetical protein
MSNTKLILCRDVETGKIYADPKTDVVIGRLKHKTISSYYGMHREPIFCLQFEIDEFTKPIVLYSDWSDKFYQVAEPRKPSLFQLAKAVIKNNPQIDTCAIIDEIMVLEQEK